jgi:pyruvate/2-oxoglutarate dehydrogenase complex dihydrolipoamide acyltransferase (E2) component
MVNWRNTHKKEFQEKHSEKLTFTPLFIQAVTKALKDFPNMNSSLDGKNIIVKDELNVGMATALPLRLQLLQPSKQSWICPQALRQPHTARSHIATTVALIQRFKS